MHRLRVRNKRGRRGSAMVEFAVMSPVFFALMGGIMDFSRVFHLSMSLNNAARAGIQYAAFSPTNMTNYDGIAQAARDSQPNVTGMAATAQLICRQDPTNQESETDGAVVACNGATFQRQYLEVVTSKGYDLFSTYLLLPGSLTVRGRAVIRLQ